MQWIKNSFAFDLRSIAVFRILLGTMILWDLVLRSQDIAIFYTDSGVLPRHHWIDITHRWFWSIHAASGELWWQVILFLLAGLCALGLIVGYRSKAMALCSFVLLASLQNRNTMLWQGGDLLLMVMAFWSLFLPLGARYSFDSALRPEHQKNPNPETELKAGSKAESTVNTGDNQQQYFSLATVAITLQILYLYLFTALLKTGDAWTENFDAAHYAVSLKHFATPIGEWFRSFPGFLNLSTGFVLGVEFIAPLLVLCPLLYPRIRLIGLALLASLHAAFLFMLHIGLFPFIDFMALSLLIPGAVWVWLRRGSEHTRNVVMHYDEDCGFCLKMCLILRSFLVPREVIIQPAQNTPEINEILQRENSWVVTDGAGKTYTHWHAMAFLFSQRWPFKPIGWLMSVPPFVQIGNSVYRWIANNRDTMSSITARALPYRRLKLTPTVAGSVLALAGLYLATAYNLFELPALRGKMPQHIEYASRVVRLDQRWDMFAPYPSTESIYPLVSGKLRDKTEIDLYSLTSSNSEWKAPENYYNLYPSYRWRKYLSRVRSHKNNVVRRSLGDYYCRSWNHKQRQRPEQLATLQIRYAVTKTTLNSTLPAVEKRHQVWRHWCFPEYADSG